MKQLPARWFQALWMSLHLQAAAFAQVAVLMHLASAEYHRRRMEDDPPEDHDLSYQDAIEARRLR